MSLPRAGFPSLLLILLAFVSCAFAGDLLILTEDAPPLNYIPEGGGLTGPSAEIVREIQHRIGDQSPIKVWPWARSYFMIKHEPGIMLFSMARSEAREELFQWVGPIGDFSWAFIALKDAEIVLETIDDARELEHIGVYHGDVREEYLRDLGFTNLDVTTTPRSLIMKLIHNRNQVILFDMNGAVTTAMDSGLDPTSFQAILEVKTMDLYCAFSKDTPDEVIRTWQKALDQMKADGTYQAILEKWDLW